MLERLGRAGARWRYAILGVWAAVALAGGRLRRRRLRPHGVRGGDARGQSARAQERLDELAPEGETVVAVIGGQDFFTPALIESATDVMYELREFPGVDEVRDAYTAGGPDRATTSAARSPSSSSTRSSTRTPRSRWPTGSPRSCARSTRREVLVGGKLLAERTFAEQATEDAVRGEAIALVVLAVVLVLFGGGLVAGALPLLAALATIAGSLLVAQRARARGGGQRVRGQRRHAARARARRRLQPAGRRALPRGARRGSGRAAAGPAGADDRGRRAAPCSSPGWRSRIALAALYVVRRPAAVGDGARRRAGGRHGDGRRRSRSSPRWSRSRTTASRRPARAPGSGGAGAPSSPGLLARLAAFAQRRPAAVALTVTAALLALSSRRSASTWPTPTRARCPRTPRSGGSTRRSSATSPPARSSRSTC